MTIAGRIRDSYRERQLRKGRLPVVRRLSVLPRAREGVFRLGVKAGGGEMAWDPWGADPPHLLVTGSTGGGKSRLMEMMALAAREWGWDVEVIDLKGGGDFWMAESHGAVVWSTPKDSAACLVRAADDIARRNQIMRTVPVVRERDDGREVEDRATTMRDLPRAVRQEHEMRPRLVLVDETASILDDKKGEGMPALRRAVQLGRSAGVHLLIGMQRPDADLLPGFVKHNVQGRILFGYADAEAEKMVLGSAVGMLDDIERTAPRPAGRAISSGVGGRPIARWQAYLLDRDTYLPFHRGPAHLVSSDHPVCADPDSPGDVDPSAGVVRSSGYAPGGPGASPSSRPPPAARSTFAPLARARLRLGALRCLVGPVRAGPFDRDPDLAASCKRSAGYRCAACGGGPPVQADHRRPLSFGGRDSQANLWALCVPCHRAKTGVETTVRAWRRRRGALRGVPLPRLALWQWAALVAFAAGALDGRWGIGAALIFVAFWLGPDLVRYYMVPKPFRKKRGPGLDGAWTGDALAEERAPGHAGAAVRGRNRIRWANVSVRVGVMGATGIYVGGVVTRAYGMDVALVALRVLSPF